MRHLRLSATLFSLVLITTGCGPDSTSDSNKALNPATSVSISFKTLSIIDEEGLPNVLPNTIFYDFYAGLEPVNQGDDENTAAALRGRIDELMGLTPDENDRTTYVAARNPLDFLNFVIDSNQVTTFNEGRQLMRKSVTRGDPARYNTQANGATIRFTGPDESNDTEEEIWQYPLLDWTSAPLTGTILTARQFVAQPPGDESETPSEVKSAVWSARFNASEFSVSGYNEPEFALFSQTTRTLGNGELQKEHIGRKRDTFFLINPPPQPQEGEQAPQCDSVSPEEPLGITIAGEQPDCIRVVVDYAESEVRVFTSRNEAREQENESCTLNENFCGIQRSIDNAETVRYDSVLIDSRQ